jgi:glycosyltransferase involved in cell wall biosynthesis
MIVAGDFRRAGGMDRSNFELAQYLLDRGEEVHLVGNTVAPELSAHPLAKVHLAPRPLNSFLLGSHSLDRKGRQVARELRKRWPGLPVIVNGANCMAGDINWCHYVHNAWAPENEGMPAWLFAKHALEQRLERAREKKAYARARLVITNSNLTKNHVEECLGGESAKVKTIYLGVDAGWAPVEDEDRSTARRSLGICDRRPVALFVGALGYDNRKGFDVLFQAWKRLCQDAFWDVDLLVAGSGRALPQWQKEVAAAGLQDRIRLLGFVDNVPRLLAAADVLISPVRYEAYGLNVQEALCHGITVIVSARAGIAERFSSDFRPLLLDDPENIDACVERLKLWRSDMDGWKRRSVKLSATFRKRSWGVMAGDMVGAINEIRTAAPATIDSVLR